MKNHPNNLLSIDQFADVIGLNPWGVAQVAKNLPAGTGNNCRCALYERSWMEDDKFSRAEIAKSINSAERMFANKMGYWPAPKIFEGKVQPFPRPAGRYEPIPAIKLAWGYVQAIGKTVLTQVGDEHDVVREATMGEPTFKDSFEVIVPVPSGTLASEIEVYFTPTDRSNLRLADWQIRPVVVSIEGINAVITGPSYLLAKPSHMQKMPPKNLDATDEETYVSKVVVYRRTLDTCQQGQLIWLKGDCSTTPCQDKAVNACFQVVSGRHSKLQASQVTTCSGNSLTATDLYRDYLPDKVSVNYIAGYPLQDNGLMNEWHAQIICWLAAALMVCETCACGCVRDMLKEYRSAPTYDTGGDDTDITRALTMTPTKLGEGFGIPRLGAIMAWNNIQLMQASDSETESIAL